MTDTPDLGAWLAPLRALALRRTRLAVTLRRDVNLQDPMCSVVRGLTAQGLRHARCLTGAERCAGCTEVARCDYAALVGVGDEDPGDGARPWWLGGVPGATEQLKGARWEVSLVSVPSGAPRVSPLVASLVDALECVGARGPVRNLVEELDAGPVTWPSTGREVRALRVVTVSPFLVRFEGSDDLGPSAARCPEAPWLSLLAGVALRRVSALVSGFAGARTERVRLPDLRGVRLREGTIERWVGSRYSHAQDRRMPLRGFSGEAIVEGEGVAALAPLLEAAAVTAVGRGTTLGFGSLRVEAVP